MRGPIRLKSRPVFYQKARKYFLVCLICMSIPGRLSSQTLHGFVLAGDPASAGGATWTYRDTVGGVIYDLAGILLKPAVGSNLPAVVISHGHNNNVNTYSMTIAQRMRSWGLVCIATNYTHAGGVPIGSPGDSTQPGASLANIQRARKCVGILASLGYVDTTRIAAHGNSMGAFVTAAVVGTFPSLFRAASHSAGGVNDLRLAWTKAAQANGIATPYQIHHGDADTTVPLRDDLRLDSILQARSIVHQMYIYPGYSHTDITFDTTMLDRVRSWYMAHGLLTVSGANERDAGVPSLFSLEQNYPNPFNPTTEIQFSIANTQFTILKVYDILGREVAVLVDETKSPGTYEVQFDASGLASGVYLYRLTAGSYVETQRMVVVK